MRHIDPENLQSLNEVLGSSVGKKIVRIERFDSGNMNLSLRLVLEDDTTLFCKQGRPWVEKYPQVEAPVGRTSLEGWFLQSLADTPVGSNTPKVVSMLEEDQILVLEDLGSTNDGMGLYEADMPRDTVDSSFADSLGYLAKLHAVDVSELAPPQANNMAMRKLNAFHMYEFPFSSEGVGFVAENFSELAKLHQGATEAVSASKVAVHLSGIYLGETSSNSVMLHGDFYPGSWMHNAKKEFYCIDPEFGFVGAKEFDLAIFIAHAGFCGSSYCKKDSLFSYLELHPGTDIDLAYKFAGIEILRRLF